MTDNTNGDKIPLKVVQLVMDNFKQSYERTNKEISDLETAVVKIIDHLNNPPRNQELAQQISALNTRVTQAMTEIHDSIDKESSALNNLSTLIKETSDRNTFRYGVITAAIAILLLAVGFYNHYTNNTIEAKMSSALSKDRQVMMEMVKENKNYLEELLKHR